jgi:hypothetical protein
VKKDSRTRARERLEIWLKRDIVKERFEKGRAKERLDKDGVKGGLEKDRLHILT